MADAFSRLRKIISEEKRIVDQLRKEPQNQVLLKELKRNNDSIPSILEGISLPNKFPSFIGKELANTNITSVKEENAETLTQMKEVDKTVKKIKLQKAEKEALKLQDDVIKRVKRGTKKVEVQKVRKANPYIKLANKFFSKTSLSLYKNESFSSLKKDLIQANLNYLPVSYISTILFTTLLSFFVGIFLVVLTLFLDVTIKFPFIISFTGDVMSRFIRVFWIMFAVPILTFLVMFFYPSVERNYIKDKINQELPFVTIHMAAISGSMVEPSKIFEIITVTKEYPYTSKEFTKIINEINIYGYNLVAALRETAMNTASSKLSDLLNGIGTTITSGGNIQRYFEKKSQSLLFDYRLQRERYTRMAETFMDIYISVVIAAPMILMLLLMMIKISGLGISLSTQTLTLIVIGGVSFVNVIFITFLYLKQPES